MELKIVEKLEPLLKESNAWNWKEYISLGCSILKRLRI